MVGHRHPGGSAVGFRNSAIYVMTACERPDNGLLPPIYTSSAGSGECKKENERDQWVGRKYVASGGTPGGIPYVVVGSGYGATGWGEAGKGVFYGALGGNTPGGGRRKKGNSPKGAKWCSIWGDQMGGQSGYAEKWSKSEQYRENESFCVCRLWKGNRGSFEYS